MNTSASFNKLAEPSAKDFRLAAMNLLARREQSYQELITKLSIKFSIVEQHFLILLQEQCDRLREENLQSDERFTESFINSNKNSGKGPLMISQQLQQKGVALCLIEQGINVVDTEWADIAKSVYKKKYGGIPISDLKDKAKRFRFMQSRGFTLDHYSMLIDG